MRYLVGAVLAAEYIGRWHFSCYVVFPVSMTEEKAGYDWDRKRRGTSGWK